MAKFVGTWKFFEAENLEGEMTASGCPPAITEKVQHLIKLTVVENTWDPETRTVVADSFKQGIENSEGRRVMRLGATLPFADHLPDLTTLVTKLEDDLVCFDVFNIDGEKVGVKTCAIEKNKLVITTTVKEVTSRWVLQKVQ